MVSEDTAGSESWRRSTEVLIHELSLLLEERDQLERALISAHLELAVARATIDELQHLNAILQIELTRKKEKSNRSAVAAIAGAVGLVVGSFVGGLADEAGKELWKSLRGVQDQANTVVVTCGFATTPSASLTVTPAPVENKADVPAPNVVSGVQEEMVPCDDEARDRRGYGGYSTGYAGEDPEP
jgi:hypothetical protein